MRLKSLSKIIQTQNIQRHVVDNLQELKVKTDILKALYAFLFPTGKKNIGPMYITFLLLNVILPHIVNKDVVKKITITPNIINKR